MEKSIGWIEWDDLFAPGRPPSSEVSAPRAAADVGT